MGTAWGVFPGEVSEWNGFRRYDFVVAERPCHVVVPDKAAKGNPWVWRARFFGHEPQADLELLRRGYHLAYCDVANLFGSPTAVRIWQAFYEKLSGEHGLAKKVALEGMSRGGLIIYGWAASYPHQVACLYGDAPVCDLRSWPLGRGRGKRSATAWKAALRAYGKSEEEMLVYQDYPIDRLKPLALAGVPILHVVGEADEVVPVEENSEVIERRYRKLGGLIEVIRKPEVGHHPHALKDPAPIVDFIERHTRAALQEAPLKHVRPRNLGALRRAMDRMRKNGRGTLAFIGGSITEMEGYRPMVAEGLQARLGEAVDLTFINAGIASTCSTTGAFRLERDVLAHGNIDLLFVEFAVNDDQDAAHDPDACVRGMEGLVRQVRRQQPEAGLVMTYFINPPMLEQLGAGKMPLSVEAHEAVASRYEIASIHLASEVAARVTEGRMTWKQYGGTHPAPVGNRLAMRLIEGLFDQVASASASTESVALPEPLNSECYERGRLLAHEALREVEGWKIAVPEWAALEGACRERFREEALICSETPGASLEVPFTGRAIGAYVLAGPDAGVLEGTIDGKPFDSVDLYHRHSKGLHYPRTVMFAVDLEPGEHVLKLRLAERRQGEGGNAARLLNLVAN